VALNVAVAEEEDDTVVVIVGDVEGTLTEDFRVAIATQDHHRMSFAFTLKIKTADM